MQEGRNESAERRKADVHILRRAATTMVGVKATCEVWGFTGGSLTDQDSYRKFG